MIVFDLDYREHRVWLPHRRARSSRGKPGFHRFDPTKILLDPYAKAIGGRDVWGQEPDWNDVYQHRGRVVYDDFDWEGDRPLEIPLEDLVIYEAHVRSFTRHPSSGVQAIRAPSPASARRSPISRSWGSTASS